jgi:hypothetical protein
MQEYNGTEFLIYTNDLFICANIRRNLINLGEKANEWKIVIHVINFQIHEQLKI